MTNESRAPLAVFLGLTFALSAVFWSLIVAAGSMRQGLYALGLMWCPGVSALATRFVFPGGAPPGRPRSDVARWIGVAYVLPLGYAAAGYGIVWMAGLGAVDLSRFQGSVVGFVILGSLQSLLSATGEELGWRGFLVPALARRMSFGWTALISGGIWAAWHVPIIVLSDYNAGTPAWYAVLCFTVGITSLAVALAWLTGSTRWLTGEFGAALAAALGATAWLFWRQRGSVASQCAAPATAAMELSRQLS